MATGLSNTQTVVTEAGVTHPDRLFQFVLIPNRLDDDDVAYALVEPARRQGAGWQPDAIGRVLELTGGYPAHLQLLAHYTWESAAGPVITPADVDHVAEDVVEYVRAQTLGPRWDSMPLRQKEFLAALAVLGGAAPVREVIRLLRVPSAAARSTVRAELITAGDIYVPRYGYLRISMPMMIPYILDEYEAARAEEPDLDTISMADMTTNAP